MTTTLRQSERNRRCNARNLAVITDNGTKGGIETAEAENPSQPPPSFCTKKEKILSNVVLLLQISIQLHLFTES